MLGQWTIYDGVSKVWKERSLGTSAQEKINSVLHPARSIARWALVCSLLLNVMFPTPLDMLFLLGGLLKAAWWAAVFQSVVRSLLLTTFLLGLTRSAAIRYPYQCSCENFRLRHSIDICTKRSPALASSGRITGCCIQSHPNFSYLAERFTRSWKTLGPWAFSASPSGVSLLQSGHQIPS